MGSRKPLSPEELVVAVLQDPERPFQTDIDINIRFVLDTCKNLIKVEHNGLDTFKNLIKVEHNLDAQEICRFAHLSVQEYLEIHHYTKEEATNFVLGVHVQYWFREQGLTSHMPRSWHRRMSEWYMLVKSLDGRVSPATSRLIEQFLGGPLATSLPYRRWGDYLCNRRPHQLRYIRRITELDITGLREKGFHCAWVGCVALGLIDILRRWLETQAIRPEDMVHENMSALGLAWEWKQDQIWDLLVGFRVGVNLPMRRHNNPLHEVLRRWPEMNNKVLHLLQNGADPNIKYAGLSTPLHPAAGRADATLCRLLLEHGADPNINHHDLGAPLHVAAKAGDLAVCALLLEHGADPNIHSYYRGVPLHVAAQNGRIAVCELLLDFHADVDSIGFLLETPLQVAATFGHAALCALLLRRGADVNRRGGQYGTALLAAVAHIPITSRGSANSRSIIQLLLDAGADVNATAPARPGGGASAMTALHKVASQEGTADFAAADIAAALIARGARVDAVAPGYGTPLQAALRVHGADSAVVRVLLRAEAVAAAGLDRGARSERSWKFLDDDDDNNNDNENDNNDDNNDDDNDDNIDNDNDDDNDDDDKLGVERFYRYLLGGR
ncbi:ankyrin repeat-containing domain protein [Xylariaceae sp. FL0804]|nr:ankyrin repeat-containing domain protein [Xylariaceae sp. FL0804]